MGCFCSSSVHLLFVVCLTFPPCKCRKCCSSISRKLMRKPYSCSWALTLSGRYSKAQYCYFLDVPSVQCVVWGSGRGSEQPAFLVRGPSSPNAGFLCFRESAHSKYVTRISWSVWLRCHPHSPSSILRVV